MKKVSIFESRRNHFQVLTDILELCKIPQAKTHILRKSNTTFKLLQNYMLQLDLAGLIEVEPKSKKYLTTKQGRKFIAAWKYVNALIYPEEMCGIKTNKTGSNEEFVKFKSNNQVRSYVTAH